MGHIDIIYIYIYVYAARCTTVRRSRFRAIGGGPHAASTGCWVAIHMYSSFDFRAMRIFEFNNVLYYLYGVNCYNLLCGRELK